MCVWMSPVQDISVIFDWQTNSFVSIKTPFVTNTLFCSLSAPYTELCSIAL